jgi:hypothetical protein
MSGLVTNILTFVTPDGTTTVVMKFASLTLGFMVVVSYTFCGGVDSGVLLSSILLLMVSIPIIVVLLVVPIIVAVVVVVAVMAGVTLMVVVCDGGWFSCRPTSF